VKSFKNFTKILFKSLVLVAAVSFFVFARNVSAEEFVSTTDIVKEIEKTLLFDKDSREQVDFYKSKKTRSSDFNMVAGNPESAPQANSAIAISVTDAKSENMDLAEKQKIAYNAVLIGQYEVAIEIYKKVLAADPTDTYSKFSLAIVYQKIGQFRQAKTLYHELLKTNPANQEEIIGNLLAILVEESPRDAIYLLSRLTVQNPKSSYILAQAAMAYDKIKNYDQAIALLEKAIALEPSNLGYKYNLAVIYDKMSNYEKALDLYANVAKNSASDNPLVPFDQVRKRIESIRNKL
jgi:tetratricopeptide (TPR) repeat protein